MVAVTFTILTLLLLAGTASLIIGFLNLAKDKGVAFIALSGLVFLLTGALLWSNGLELNKVASIDTTTDNISITYQNITVSDGSPFWVFVNFLFFGGFLLILTGFGHIMEMRRIRKLESEESY